MKLETLQKDMITAMKEKNKDRKETLAALISASKNLAIAKMSKDNISEDIVNDAIMKELKAAKEQIDTCPAERTDLLEAYRYRLSVIEEYAPKMMSEDEIKEFINSNYADVIATKNKGMIMKTIMPALKGKADGKLINQVITEMMK